jgi:hypothetical protein
LRKSGSGSLDRIFSLLLGLVAHWTYHQMLFVRKYVPVLRAPLRHQKWRGLNRRGLPCIDYGHETDDCFYSDINWMDMKLLRTIHSILQAME